MNRCSRRRLPAPLRPVPLLALTVAASLPAWPFWLLWHPLGTTVAAVLFAAGWLVLLAGSRPAARSHSTATAYARAAARTADRP